jgi:hypothetical protein
LNSRRTLGRPVMSWSGHWNCSSWRILAISQRVHERTTSTHTAIESCAQGGGRTGRGRVVTYRETISWKNSCGTRKRRRNEMPSRCPGSHQGPVLRYCAHGDISGSLRLWSEQGRSSTSKCKIGAKTSNARVFKAHCMMHQEVARAGGRFLHRRGVIQQ